MKVYIGKNYEEMSRIAANVLSAQVMMKPDCVLGLATGSTPIGTYKVLIERCAQGDLDFSQVKSINLDEYVGLSGEHDQSYRYFMNNNLFNHINIDKANTNVPNGLAEDGAAEGARYEALIASLGGIDLQILGIGQNGHIGFNEPGDELYPTTHLTDLTPSTIKANSRFFASEDDVPKQALSMGMGSILNARKIVIMASGAAKHDAIMKMLSGVMTTKTPATFLACHADVTLICDEAAYNG
jgi:glucosamine-6-phosphate deaminase